MNRHLAPAALTVAAMFLGDAARPLPRPSTPPYPSISGAGSIQGQLKATGQHLRRNRDELSVSDSLVHLYTASNSGLKYPLRVVLRDSSAFLGVWREITSNQVDPQPPPQPNIDFTNDMVIIAAMGFHPITGASIHIQSIGLTGSNLEILVTLRVPDSTCVGGAMAVYPVDIVRFQHGRGVATFVDHYEPYSCGH